MILNVKFDPCRLRHAAAQESGYLNVCELAVPKTRVTQVLMMIRRKLEHFHMMVTACTCYMHITVQHCVHVQQNSLWITFLSLFYHFYHHFLHWLLPLPKYFRSSNGVFASLPSGDLCFISARWTNSKASRSFAGRIGKQSCVMIQTNREVAEKTLIIMLWRRCCRPHTDIFGARNVSVRCKSCKVAQCSRQPAESGLSPGCGSMPTHAGVSGIKGPTVSRLGADTRLPELHDDQLEPRVPLRETCLDPGGLCSVKPQRAPAVLHPTITPSTWSTDDQRKGSVLLLQREKISGRKLQIWG